MPLENCTMLFPLIIRTFQKFEENDSPCQEAFLKKVKVVGKTPRILKHVPLASQAPGTGHCAAANKETLCSLVSSLATNQGRAQRWRQASDVDWLLHLQLFG
jgi:hypothetical protein